MAVYTQCTMTLFNKTQIKTANAVSQLVYCNPFTPARIEGERLALGAKFIPSQPVWSLSSPQDAVSANVTSLRHVVEVMVSDARAKLIADVKATPRELGLYEDLSLYRLYDAIRDPLTLASQAALTGQSATVLHKVWPGFYKIYEHDLCLPGVGGLPQRSAEDAAHVFACFFQLRRAFANIFHYLVGGSMPMAHLRAGVWESIFTHDLRRYYRGFYRHMGDFATLVTGESGTGKELVARAIGHSRYQPFDVKTGRFAEESTASFQAVNLAALSPALIESELFGHKRGAFTGAIADRKGWLETCPPRGTVFLDEIGELEGSLQVKLLRVLQTRTFERIGETAVRHFDGKVIAATNRNLALEMHEGRFRGDLYFRLCSDVIHTPSLKEQLEDRPDDLANMVDFIMRGLTTDTADAASNTDEVVSWINTKLGSDYTWPGNFRELEQCVRNVMIRGRYTPLHALSPASSGHAESHLSLSQIMRQLIGFDLSAEDLLTQYVAQMYDHVGSYEGTARRLGLDRRTVKAKVDALADTTAKPS